MNPRIFLSSPHMGDWEQSFVKKAFAANYVAPLGPQVDEFEQVVSSFVGVSGGVALISGTAAIHMALKCLDVQPGDVVFCSDLTFAGSCNPILYQGAVPVFIDSEPESYNMSPVALAKAFEKHKCPKAVIVVNLYGQSADYAPIEALCSKYSAPIIEDAAESLGATYRGKKSGGFGRYGILSFNGNKIITTSGGGMLLSNDLEGLEKARFWSTQAKEKCLYYLHKELGYNYRLSNICAAIGLGQMTVLEERIRQKKYIYQTYQKAFQSLEPVRMYPVADFGKPNYWLSVMLIDPKSSITPTMIIQALEEENIESRPVWNPMHWQPLYKNCDFFRHGEDCVSELLFECGLCLPSDTKMTDADMSRITSVIEKLFENN